MLYFDGNKNLLNFNDYVNVKTDIGMYQGYINSLQNGKVKVNCLAGEFRVSPDNVFLIAHIL